MPQIDFTPTIQAAQVAAARRAARNQGGGSGVDTAYALMPLLEMMSADKDREANLTLGREQLASQERQGAANRDSLERIAKADRDSKMEMTRMDEQLAKYLSEQGARQELWRTYASKSDASRTRYDLMVLAEAAARKEGTAQGISAITTGIAAGKTEKEKMELLSKFNESAQKVRQDYIGAQATGSSVGAAAKLAAMKLKQEGPLALKSGVTIGGQDTIFGIPTAWTADTAMQEYMLKNTAANMPGSMKDKIAAALSANGDYSKLDELAKSAGGPKAMAATVHSLEAMRDSIFGTVDANGIVQQNKDMDELQKSDPYLYGEFSKFATKLTGVAMDLRGRGYLHEEQAIDQLSVDLKQYGSLTDPKQREFATGKILNFVQSTRDAGEFQDFIKAMDPQKVQSSIAAATPTYESEFARLTEGIDPSVLADSRIRTKLETDARISAEAHQRFGNATSGPLPKEQGPTLTPLEAGSIDKGAAMNEAGQQEFGNTLADVFAQDMRGHANELMAGYKFILPNSPPAQGPTDVGMLGGPAKTAYDTGQAQSALVGGRPNPANQIAKQPASAFAPPAPAGPPGQMQRPAASQPAGPAMTGPVGPSAHPMVQPKPRPMGIPLAPSGNMASAPPAATTAPIAPAGQPIIINNNMAPIGQAPDFNPYAIGQGGKAQLPNQNPYGF